jgi:Domain of unknown function (DUF4145)
MEKLEMMTRCGHCGNIGNCKIRASYNYDISCEAPDNYEQRIWLLLQCSACSRPLLFEITNFEEKRIEDLSKFPFMEIMFSNGMSQDPVSPDLFENYSMDNHILYPLEKSLSYSLPDEVRSAYSSALKVKYVEPNAFAVMIGRTLEVMCHHENANGKVLADKIKSLADSERIPQTLADMARQLRILRNSAVHADKDKLDIKEEDVQIIHEFAEAILEYLYIAPGKVADLQDRIDGKPNLLDDFKDNPPF